VNRRLRCGMAAACLAAKVSSVLISSSIDAIRKLLTR
jgi:hypothetical protein